IHRGCLALVERPAPGALEDVPEATTLAVVLDSISNPDNVGGIFRNAAAFGVDTVMLSPNCCDPLYRKAIRTSMGATLHMPFIHLQPWPEALTSLRAARFRLVALTPRTPSEPLDIFCQRVHDPKLALIVGAEGPGL